MFKNYKESLKKEKEEKLKGEDKNENAEVTEQIK